MSREAGLEIEKSRARNLAGSRRLPGGWRLESEAGSERESGLLLLVFFERSAELQTVMATNYLFFLQT